MAIKNIIFDIGNVLVRWSPLEAIQATFPQFDPADFYKRMRPIWIDLNLGKFSERVAVKRYTKLFNLPEEDFFQLTYILKTHQEPLPGSIELLEELQTYNITLFSITDNVKEIIEYHKIYSAFPKYFKDIIVSADVGILKPDPRIYDHLLTKHNLHASESLFIDDTLSNVEGATKAGIRSILFIDNDSCRKKLLSLLKA